MWSGMKKEYRDSSWHWYDFEDFNLEALQEIAAAKPHYDLDYWIKKVEGTTTNSIVINTLKPGAEWVGGSLVFRQDLVEKDDNHIFHFLVGEDFLITTNLEFSVLGKNNNKDILDEQMENAANAIEGFSVLLGEVMTSSLIKIDPFEVKLKNLLWKMKEENSTEILEEIYQCRHELLVLKHLMIPIREIKIALEEAFAEKIADKPYYQRICLKVERGFTIVSDYQAEIDTLINLEEVVSSHRGNEIMKTLTVLTTLFTPVTELGAIWGMNFKHMPELGWKYGYLFSFGVIIFSTLLLYVIVKRKGWFGDILKGKKKNTFFK
jgi:Mg2+ and Co2+ transporter CorA